MMLMELEFFNQGKILNMFGLISMQEGFLGMSSMYLDLIFSK